MKLSVKSDYAARAVLALARRAHAGVPVPVETLAEDHHIPSSYLVQILLELKAQKIVRSHRGKDGGYQLARPPSEITLGDIVRCVHGHAFDTPAIADPHCPPELRDAWQDIQRAVDARLDAVNFQQLADSGLEKDRMYYI
ncbi:MAG: Rrf2 family transcriptional regulator [Limisphaerales bacterium]